MAYISSGAAGVEVREIDLTGIVPAVATTEGAMAGNFVWGPAYERVLIESEAELVSTFGKPNDENFADWFTASNFLAYGNKLYIVRAVDHTNANTALQATNATASNTSGFLVQNDDDYENNYSDGTLQSTFGTGPFIAKYAGALGNSIKISICPSASAYQSTLTGTLSTTANSNVVTGANTNFSAEVVVGDLLVVNNEVQRVAAITNATSLTTQSVFNGSNSAVTGVRRWEYYVEVDTAPGTSNYTASNSGVNDEMHIVIVDAQGKWTGVAGQILEVFQDVSKARDAKFDDGSNAYYKEFINQNSQYVRWAGHENSIANIGNEASSTTFGTPDLPINYTLIGGSNGATPGSDEKIEGYSLFRNTEEIDISFVLGSDNTQTVAVYIINNICEYRKDCVAFLSPPRNYVVNNRGNEARDILTYRNLLPSTSYAALDGNWKYQYDRYNDVYRFVPMNGDVGGINVRTDEERDPWWPAAGLNRGLVKNVIKLAWVPSKTDQDVLYRNNVNPIVSFPGDGVVLWGQKTLQAKASAFDRLNVRRLFIVLEKAIKKAARYMLFEINDEFSRTQFRNMIEPYLRDVQGRRGIYDFKVICDETNNTGEVIDRNEFIGDIYIKPARAIEFIRLNFIAVRTGVDFNTVIGKW